MLTLDLDERTLLTIRNALWLAQQHAAAAELVIVQALAAQVPEPPKPEKPEKSKVNGAHP